MKIRILSLALLLGACLAAADLPTEGVQWRPLALTFDGPETSEDASPNPFRDYRMTVTFTQPASGRKVVVPGFFAADGDAGETSAKSGDQWRARFTPPSPGSWTWKASFRQGEDVALSSDSSAGQGVSFNGREGSLTVAPAPADAPGFQAKGFLQPSGSHYLRFSNGDRFLKGGADSPENFLGYFEFDDTYDTEAHGRIETDKGKFIHKYEPHAGDWNAGDPTWKGGKGKNIIGAVNYLASKGMNSIYFLTYNLDGGDGKDTWMWSTPDVRDRFDVSKLAQWEVVFDHMERKGVMMHVILQETENDENLGGGPELNVERMLYLRELISRFGHHLAIVWNLGEENDTPRPDRRDIAQYIGNLDPGKHAVTVHTHNKRARRSYTGIMGLPEFQATSIQGLMSEANAETISLRARSAAAGNPWVIFHDEQTPASTGVMPDKDDPRHDKPRTEELWGNLMGGGAGVEWYFGYAYDHMDLSCEDWRSRDTMWNQTRYALEFFQNHLPYWEMGPANEVVEDEDAYVFAKEGDLYAVYLPNGGKTRIYLAAGEYTIQWYDPRQGGALQKDKQGELAVHEASMQDHGDVTIEPPHHPSQDWAALIRRK